MDDLRSVSSSFSTAGMGHQRFGNNNSSINNTLQIIVHSAQNMPKTMGFLDKTDAYVQIVMGTHTRKTNVKKNAGVSATFEETFVIPYAEEEWLTIYLKDRDRFSSDDLIGTKIFHLLPVIEAGGSWSGLVSLDPAENVTTNPYVHISLKIKSNAPVPTGAPPYSSTFPLPPYGAANGWDTRNCLPYQGDPSTYGAAPPSFPGYQPYTSAVPTALYMNPSGQGPQSTAGHNQPFTQLSHGGLSTGSQNEPNSNGPFYSGPSFSGPTFNGANPSTNPNPFELNAYPPAVAHRHTPGFGSDQPQWVKTKDGSQWDERGVSQQPPQPREALDSCEDGGSPSFPG